LVGRLRGRPTEGPPVAKAVDAAAVAGMTPSEAATVLRRSSEVARTAAILASARDADTALAALARSTG